MSTPPEGQSCRSKARSPSTKGNGPTAPPERLPNISGKPSSRSHSPSSGLSRGVGRASSRRGLAKLGFDHHEADHPVGLVLREVADEREWSGLVECDRG